MPNKNDPYYPSKYEQLPPVCIMHNGDEIRPLLAQSLDGACSPAAVGPVVPGEDLEALWKPHRSYAILQLSRYLQGRIPEAHIVYTLSNSSYVQSLHALIARIGTFRSIITVYSR